jgi:polar amino acid transport system substrate-binding protein
MAALLLSASSVFADDISIRADYWYPFNGKPNSTKPGYLIEIAEQALTEAGHTVHYQLMPWDDAIGSARKGLVDCVAGVSKKEAADFIFPDVSMGMADTGFFVRYGEYSQWRYRNVDSFNGMRIGIIDGVFYINDTAFADYIEQNAQTDKVYIAKGDEPLQDLMNKLASKEIDMLLETPEVFSAISHERGVFLLFDQADRLNSPGAVYIACSPKNKHSATYVKLISNKLVAMRKSGELDSLLKKYHLQDWQE